MARVPSRPPDERVRSLLRARSPEVGARADDWAGDWAGEVPAGEGAPGPALREWARQAGLKPLDVPGPLRAARLRFGPRQLAAVLLVVAVAALVLVMRVVGARNAAEVRPIGGPSGVGAGSTLATSGAPTRPSAAPGLGSAAGTGAAVPTATAGGPVVVHVVGQVKRPGVVSLPSGSRVLAAVQAAGGPAPTAVLSRLNLARIVVDGEQILVPGSGDVATGSTSGAAGSGSVGSVGSGSGVGGSVPGAPKPPAAPVNLNTATIADLDALPGIGPVLAARIVAWRDEHGRFSSVDELGEVSGIGDKLFARLRSAVTVS